MLLIIKNYINLYKNWATNRIHYRFEILSYISIIAIYQTIIILHIISEGGSMKLELNPEMSFDKMTNLLTEKFPQYEVKLLKNPVAKFQYIQVKKSAFSGVWIRRYEKKGRVQLINAVPSALARGFLGFWFVGRKIGSE